MFFVIAERLQKELHSKCEIPVSLRRCAPVEMMAFLGAAKLRKSKNNG
jgi:hypothetical protein